METKTCVTCTRVLTLDSFHKKGKSPNGKPRFRNDCKDCKSKLDRATYNAEKTYDSSIKRVHRNKKIVVDHLLSHPCVDCGEDNIVVLEFDHVRGEKFMAISQLVVRKSSVDVLVAEMAKCDVRCANCHRKVTAERGKWTVLDYI